VSALDELLPPAARLALAKAAGLPMSYGARYLLTPSTPGTPPRLVVMLGEAHVKLEPAAALGKELARAFELRGVETFQSKEVFAGRALSFLIRAPRLLLRALSFGLVKGSTIVDAKALETGHTVELERTTHVPLALHVGSFYLATFFAVLFAHAALTLLAARTVDVVADAAAWLTVLLLLFELHFPALFVAWALRRHSWSWVLHPMIAILTVRDTLLADGTARMMKEHPEARAALVIMGRAHLPGCERELVERHGFVRIG
jgi:hypothetical protein